MIYKKNHSEIVFQTSKGYTSAEIFDVTGKRVAQLRRQGAVFSWKCQVANNVYLYRLTGGGVEISGTVVVR